MQAVGVIRNLIRILSALALGIAAIWLGFLTWNSLAHDSARLHRPAARRILPNSPVRQNSEIPVREMTESGSDLQSATAASSDSSAAASETGVVLASGDAETEAPPSQSAETVPPAQAAPTATATASSEGPNSDVVRRLLEVANQHFANGNLAECIERFQFLLPNTQGVQRRLVAVKLGITAENLSDLDLAVRAYSISLEQHADDELADLARLRIGAILASRGDCLGARSHLSDWWLSGGMGHHSQYENSAVHLLAEVQARIACGCSPSDSVINADCLRDDRVAWPFKHEPPIVELGQLEAATAPSEATVVDQPTRIEIVDQFSTSMEDGFATLQVAGRPLSGVCDVLARKAGCSLAWSEAAYRRASERNITLTLTDINLAVLLDILTRGSGLVWIQNEEGLFIVAESDLQPEDLTVLDVASARRLMQFAITTLPANERQRLTMLSLANLDFHEDRLADASHRYTQLVGLNSERLWSPEAAFNLGKVRLLLNDLEGSAAAFLKSSDGSLGHPLQPVALLYAGRLHVMLNRISEAVPLFTRAWILSRGGELEAEALINLSSIYAYLGNPVGANRVLVDHRDVVRNVGHYHDMAAFIGCYCRYQLAQSDSRKLRDGRDLLDSLANIEPEKFFSPQGWAIVMRAYRDLGLDQESFVTLQNCLAACADSPFLDEVARAEAHQLTLVEGSARPRNTSDFEEISAILGDEILHRMERIKSLLGRGEHATLVVEAELLLREPLPSTMQIELLDILGRSYQRQGEHYNAALCFARINPFSERATRLRSEYLREQTLEWGTPQP